MTSQVFRMYFMYIQNSKISEKDEKEKNGKKYNNKE